MAVIHRTTLSPGKLELLAAWLPSQPWHGPAAGQPELARAGGFRLDDPDGEVGIEFVVVTDSSRDGTAYLTPLTYRGSPLADAEAGLITTAEHGVLGRRWIYDGVRDPVLVAQLVALIQGGAQAQAQSLSNTADPTVTGRPAAPGALVPLTSAVTGNGSSGTELRIATVDPDGLSSGQLAVVLTRVLQATAGADPAEPGVSATWLQPDGQRARGVFATARYVPDRAGPAS
jgi:hypothetical protein